MPTFVPTTIADNDARPQIVIQTIYGAGMSAGANADYRILILANKASGSSGSDGYDVYGPDTLVPCRNEAECIALASAGSPAHLAYREVLQSNPGASVYLCFVKESTGSAASGTIAVTGSATANATLTVYVTDEAIPVSVVIGDSPSVIAASIASAINAKTFLPVTAAAASGNVTVTSKTKGPRGNDIGIFAKLSAPVGVTVTPSSPTKLSGGTVLDDNTQALATIRGERFYYIVSEANDAANLARLQSQVIQDAQNYLLTQRIIVGSNSASIAAVNTLATATLNSERSVLVHQAEGDLLGVQLAAQLAAGIAAKEANFTTQSLNFDHFGNTPETRNLWSVKAPLSGRKLTPQEQNACLNNGITPVVAVRGGNSEVLSLITTRSLNGSVNDYRVRDWHITSVGDRFQDDLGATYAAQLNNKTASDDLPAGEPIPVDRVTPLVLRNTIVPRIRFFAPFFKNIDAIIASVKTYHEISPKTRMSSMINLQVVDLAHQYVTTIYEVGG